MTGSPWPLHAVRGEDGSLHVAGVPVTELAERYGTPLWVVDEDDVRQRCGWYRDAFPAAHVCFASKAWPTTGLLQLAADEGLWIDVASGGELHTARLADVAMERVVFHGNNKSTEELRLAAELGVGRIAVDSFDELDRLEQLGREHDHLFRIWLRVTPGIDAHTHEYVRTGHDDTKFGFTLSLGLADQALLKASSLEHVDVVGAHAHIGSQIFGTDPFVANAEVMIELLARWRKEHGVTLGELNLGGGMGIRYTHEDHPVDVAAYGEAVLGAVAAACARYDFPPPQLAVEPGRALVAPSTITLYRVGTIKHLPGLRTYVSLDGGMSDNVRPALYDAEHEVQLANRSSEAGLEAFTLVGKHCESGDVLRDRAPLPADLRVGDLVAFAATGAYTEAMSSNYNRLPRPAAVIVRDGDARELVRRESYDDVVRRDVPLH
ncbi:MAG: diaminopimelate decarboxylase [Nitriliruptorales bacterium]|nr:diaminopimelate decarboxylase [Nitriliruptorales bacterium]